jgi:hypothetical protein
MPCTLLVSEYVITSCQSKVNIKYHLFLFLRTYNVRLITMVWCYEDEEAVGFCDIADTCHPLVF